MILSHYDVHLDDQTIVDWYHYIIFLLCYYYKPSLHASQLVQSSLLMLLNNIASVQLASHRYIDDIS